MIDLASRETKQKIPYHTRLHQPRAELCFDSSAHVRCDSWIEQGGSGATMCAKTASRESGSRSDRKSHANDIAWWGMSGWCCCGPLDDESTIRVAWV